MIYIVTGYMRSGTSMMMQCLQAGGLEAVFDKRREDMNKNFGDTHYQPNKKGFFELSYPEYNKIGFPLQYKGKLIKCLRGGVYEMAVHQYKVVYMLRDPEEIRQSYEAFFGHNADDQILSKYHEEMDKTISLLENRKDVDLCVFQYRDVVENPTKYFTILKNQGWPIDVEKAVNEVDAEQCRFRIEKLVVGL